jgi:hypothetical protein
MDSGGVPVSELQNLIVVFCGKKGRGKSYQFSRSLRSRNRLIIFDVRDEHDFTKNRLEGMDDLAEWLDYSNETIGFGSEKHLRPCAASYVPRSTNEIADFAWMIFENAEQMVVGLEEVPSYTSGGSWDNELKRLVLQARHHQLDIYACSQRFAEMPKSFTAMADRFILFRTNEPRDLSALVDRVGEECTQAVRSLQGHEVITFEVEMESFVRGVDLPGYRYGLVEGTLRTEPINKEGSSGRERIALAGY